MTDLVFSNVMIGGMDESHYKTIISETAIIEVRRDRAAGETYPALGKKYGVHPDHIRNIIRGTRRND